MTVVTQSHPTGLSLQAELNGDREFPSLALTVTSDSVTLTGYNTEQRDMRESDARLVV